MSAHRLSYPGSRAIDRLFRLSALFRQKWESRADYRDRTIARAITHVRDRYQGVSAEHNGQPSEERNASSGPEARGDCAQPSPTSDQQSGPRICGKKKTIEETHDRLKPGEVFYYADEFNISWLPTLRAMWSPRGQQIMIPTPGQLYKRYGLGAVDYHTGEAVVLFRRRKRRREVAELL